MIIMKVTDMATIKSEFKRSDFDLLQTNIC